MDLPTPPPTPSPSSSLQLIFLGTGTSTGLPLAPCLTLSEPYPSSVSSTISSNNSQLPTKPNAGPASYNPKASWPGNIPCSSCRGAVDKTIPEGWKNQRGNTSVLLRKWVGSKETGRWKNVVVDVGKTFREQACRLFPKWGVKTIDAVILTHGHADAYYGLDDLREWCGRQKTAIPVYLNRPTFETVEKSFPYLVDKSQASGGGDVPSLTWHIIEDDAAFQVEGIQVQTIPLHHGVYFTPQTRPPTPTQSPTTPQKILAPEPLICLGFIFDKSIIYLSDVSGIPENTWKIIQSTLSTSPSKSLPILIIDALWPLKIHSSHYNFVQALEIALRLNPSITYLTGFTHPTTHYQWEALGRSIVSSIHEGDGHPKDEEEATEKLIDMFWKDDQLIRDGLGDKLRSWGGRVEPAWDGLGVRMQEAEENGETGQGWEEVSANREIGWAL